MADDNDPVEPTNGNGEPSSAYRVLSNRVILTCAVVLLLVAGGAAWLLLAQLGDGTDASKTRLDAIRTVGTIVLGAGGGVALLLTARRQQTAERDLVERRRDLSLKARAQDHAEEVQRHAEKVAAEAQAHQQMVAESTEADARARRITELFDTAVDKLGSEKAAVRFGGLYALERLADHAPEQQRPIAHVLCAYLRMPYTEPDKHPPVDADEKTHSQYQLRREEREVRLAIQRVIADHLRPGSDRNRPSPSYWSDAIIDLTGATLIDLDWSECHLTGKVLLGRVRFVNRAQFEGTTFSRSVNFAEAEFEAGAVFAGASFQDSTTFDGAKFSRNTSFAGATFNGRASFEGATFSDVTWFNGAEFFEFSRFNGVNFHGASMFDEAQFHQDTWFDFATFSALNLKGATFHGDTRFGSTKFNESVTFPATFYRSAWFDKAIFAKEAIFDVAIFDNAPVFNGATFSDLVTFPAEMKPQLHSARICLMRNDQRVNSAIWPGWHVVPIHDLPYQETEKWGRLIQA
ncbi:pentapeptide repeat-containing protein [Amycolatopsis sp. lyj-109]|uniref:pentapeptide repeat-containing protein n=1 Tax=Amycolatopsis sp. lyj-109 TaxID=2789287 RepID=UPI00397A54CE